MDQQMNIKDDSEDIEQLKRALTRILAIYYSGSSDGNPWGAFCQYLDDFETKHDCPRLWVVEEIREGEINRCVLGEGLGNGVTGPLARFSPKGTIQSVALMIDKVAYEIIWHCLEQDRPSCDNCKLFQQFIELLKNKCFGTEDIQDTELKELRKCFTDLLKEENQAGDVDSIIRPSDSGETLLGNLRDDFFDRLRTEFFGELAALGLGELSRQNWDGENSRVVFQIYNPFYRAFFYRNIKFLSRNNIKEKILNKLKRYNLASNIENFERVPEPLWMVFGNHSWVVHRPDEDYLVGLAYHTRQMLFKPVPSLPDNAGQDAEEGKPRTLMGKIRDLESVLAWFQNPAPRRLHVMPLYCNGQPRGVCAIIQAGSGAEHDGRAHQLQEVISARMSRHIEDEYQREDREKILKRTHRGKENFIVECVRFSPYLLNVVAAAIYAEDDKENPSNLFGFTQSYPSPDSEDVKLRSLFENMDDYRFGKIKNHQEKLSELFNTKIDSSTWPPDEEKPDNNGFVGKGIIYSIEFDQKRDSDLDILLGGLNRATLLTKHYFGDNRMYRLCFLIDCPITAMRFHARVIDDKFNNLNELYNAFSTKIRQEKDEERIRELSHLEGVEPRIKSIIDTISTLRNQALEVQGSLFPGNMGLMKFRSDLAPLLRDEGKLYFWVSENGQPTHQYNLWEVVEELYKPIQPSQHSIKLEIRFGPNPPPGFDDREVEPFHNKNTDDEKFRKTWECYIPFLHCFGHRNRKGIPFLKDIAKTSRFPISNWDSLSSYEQDDILKREKQLFDIFKEVVHRPFNPHFVKESQASVLSMGQLLSIALEVKKFRDDWKKGTLNVEFKVNIGSKTFKTENINSTEDLLGLTESEIFDENKIKSIWHSGPLLDKHRPADFLSPLYQLLAVELASSSGGKCGAHSFELIANYSDELKLELCDVNIGCDNSLLRENLREEREAEESGLSGCLKKIANCLEQTWPLFLEQEPLEQKPSELHALRAYPFRIYNWEEKAKRGELKKAQIAFTFLRLGEAEVEAE